MLKIADNVPEFFHNQRTRAVRALKQQAQEEGGPTRREVQEAKELLSGIYTQAIAVQEEMQTLSDRLNELMATAGRGEAEDVLKAAAAQTKTGQLRYKDLLFTLETVARGGSPSMKRFRQILIEKYGLSEEDLEEVQRQAKTAVKDVENLLIRPMRESERKAQFLSGLLEGLKSWVSGLFNFVKGSDDVADKIEAAAQEALASEGISE